MTPQALADRIAALDWSATSLQHQLAVTAACETLRNAKVPTLPDDALRAIYENCPCGGWDCSGVPGGPLDGCPYVRPKQERVMANVRFFRAPSPELLRGAEYSERRVTLRNMAGETVATALLARSERWDWIVETTCALLSCDPSAVAMNDDIVTVDGLPVFSC